MKIALKNDQRTKAKKYFFEHYVNGSDIDKKETAKNLGVSFVTIYNWIKEIESK